jgi:hypothetical protein
MYWQLQPRQPELPRYQYTQPGKTDYQPGGRACEPSILAAIRERRQAARERERCAEEAEKHRLQSDDLVQQTRAADAAQAQVGLAFYQNRLLLFGTIGGWLTLVAAAAAAIYARDAARAANKSLDHAKSVADDELRPWVKIAVQPEWALNDRGRLTISLEVTLTNLGRTPAQNVRVGCKTLTFPAINTGDLPDGLLVPESSMHSWPSILPNSDVSGQELMFLDWEDGSGPSNADGETPVRALYPLASVDVLYDVQPGKSGRTVGTFWIGPPDPDNPRHLGPLYSNSGHEIRILDSRPGAQSKIE